MHCHKTGLGAQYAHPEPRSRAHYAHNAHVVGAAERTTSWSRACRARSQRRSRAQCAQVSRMLGVHWSRHAQASCPRPGRDFVPRSRPPEQLSQVTTSTPCRDLLSAQLKLPRSRPQKWNRDTNFHRPAITMSRHQINVATPLRPI